MIKEHLSTGAARRHHGELAVRFLRLGVAHRHDRIDAAMGVQHGAAKRDSLGADRQAADRCTKMQTGPNPSVPAPDRGRDCVPEWLVKSRQDLVRRGHQGVIG